ncbi:MAG: DUF4197 domain-containing protein [Hyphomonadaceae bacterium]|nr:DUF4197 domain-containing protein [Hyphomonadaceae bacterium]
MNQKGPVPMSVNAKFRLVACIAGAMFALPGCQTTGTSGDAVTVLGGILGDLGGAAGQSGLTQYEIEAGLREALTVGTQRVASQLGQTDGYFGDPEIRIPLPGDLGELQDGLARVGLSGPLDDLQLRLNRGAEAAVPQARDLVIEAVRNITLEDALAILNGGDTAATDFLRGKTETSLRTALRPHLSNALQGAGAYSAMDRVATANGLGALSVRLREDLTDSAVNYGLDGLFHYVAAEEMRIREDPVARTTELLRKVFGAQTA